MFLLDLILTGILWWPNLAEFRDTAPLRSKYSLKKQTMTIIINWNSTDAKKIKLFKKIATCVSYIDPLTKSPLIQRWEKKTLQARLSNEYSIFLSFVFKPFPRA